ncbi:general substrate transporter [Mollisia scopiformis]|uniref:General substrate transporter n=1 Tax=Mollisia scopiformis TaxID=149040 RepID=A0A194WS93_MOLSC|nr:general substrate transporter [Mollisia scopiformis]KUJ10838.1 general substrate transporter [Mollisia scopiformis]
MVLSGYPLEVALTVANSAAQAWYGYDQGVISGILISPYFISTFPQTKNSNTQGITASCFSLGNLAGCLFAALFGNRLGRKNTLRTGGTVSAIGAILQFSATSFPQLIVGRVINGMGNGMTSSTCGMYQAESCRGPRRGKLSVIVVLHNVVFYCFASWLTLACSYINNSAQWRLPLALQLIPCLAMFSLLPLLPESPRWLVMQDRMDDAQDALCRYLGKDLSPDDPEVLRELASIEEAYKLEVQSRISFKEVIMCRDRSRHLHRLLLGMGGQFMQQFGGINALNYYFPIILEDNIGLSTLMARILTGCNATSYMISSALAFWMIERAGRRTLMLSGLGLQCLAYVMVAIAIALQSEAPFQWGAVAITFLFFYYAAFGCTWGMVPWVYQAEINSLAMRTKGSAAATATNWLFGFVCTQFTPTGIKNIGYRFYIIFAAFNLLFVPIVYSLYPETSNRTLEDIDEYFDVDSGHTTIIPIGDKATKSTARPQEAIDAEVRRVETATTLVGKKTDDPTSVHVERLGAQ